MTTQGDRRRPPHSQGALLMHITSEEHRGAGRDREQQSEGGRGKPKLEPIDPVTGRRRGVRGSRNSPIAPTAQNDTPLDRIARRNGFGIHRHPLSSTLPSRPCSAASSVAQGRAVRVSTRSGQRALCASCWEVLPWIRRPIGP